jgi:HEAT repeat protein
VVHWLYIAAAGLVALSLLELLTLIARRGQLGRREQLERAAEDEVRPQALELLAGEDDASLAAPVDRRHAEALATMLGRYARQLSGDARARIAAVFERTGGVEEALRELRGWRATRRALAAYRLGDMGSERAIGPLIAALEDPDRDVRTAAARSIGQLAAVDAVPVLVLSIAGGTIPRAIASWALIQIGPGAAEPLAPLLESPDASVRAAAIDVLGLIGSPAAAPVVARGLSDPAPEVRARAARSLARVGGQVELEALRARLDDPVTFVRVTSATALGELHDRDAVEPLIRQAQEDEYDAARAAARALARIAPGRVRELVAAGSGLHLQEAAARMELGHG